MLNTIKAYQNRLYTDYITIPFNDGYYQLSASEKLIFGVKHINSKDDNYVIYKEIPPTQYNESNHGYLLTLSTDNMNISEGRYVYDIVLQLHNGRRIPIVGKSIFRVLGSVVGSENITNSNNSQGGVDSNSDFVWNQF